jgi:hypothetical protein
MNRGRPFGAKEQGPALFSRFYHLTPPLQVGKLTVKPRTAAMMSSWPDCGCLAEAATVENVPQTPENDHAYYDDNST